VAANREPEGPQDLIVRRSGNRERSSFPSDRAAGSRAAGDHAAVCLVCLAALVEDGRPLGILLAAGAAAAVWYFFEPQYQAPSG